ncbi:MAG: hypothetical protein ACTSRG_22670 [Candidatus Helarchaeota archaeon]
MNEDIKKNLIECEKKIEYFIHKGVRKNLFHKNNIMLDDIRDIQRLFNKIKTSYDCDLWELEDE